MRIFKVLFAAVLLLALAACTTAPTLTQQAQISSGITIAVDVAAGFAIQQKDIDPAIWKARAVSYKAIAVQLQSINSGGAATLSTLAVALQPLVAKLPPVDQIAANTLVAALTPYLQQQLSANPSAATVQTTVAEILNAVISACAAYGA